MQIDVSVRPLSVPQAIIIDGCAILWVIHWPSNGTVQDFVNSFSSYVFRKLRESDIYVDFDRYNDFSIKSCTRTGRAGDKASRSHTLRLESPLPPQHVILTVTSNKVQLIAFICEALIETARNFPVDNACYSHRLFVTGHNPSPFEIHTGVVIERRDLQTSHEEADVIMMQHVKDAVDNGAETISVMSDDTDVFFLLLYISI